MPMPVFNSSDELVHLEISDVLYIYKHRRTRKIIIVAECGNYYLPSTIDHIIQIMSKSGFFQIDPYRIINIKHVKWFQHNKVNINGAEFVVARRRIEGLKEALK